MTHRSVSERARIHLQRGAEQTKRVFGDKTRDWDYKQYWSWVAEFATRSAGGDAKAAALLRHLWVSSECPRATFEAFTALFRGRVNK